MFAPPFTLVMYKLCVEWMSEDQDQLVEKKRMEQGQRAKCKMKSIIMALKRLILLYIIF